MFNLLLFLHLFNNSVLSPRRAFSPMHWVSSVQINSYCNCQFTTLKEEKKTLIKYRVIPKTVKNFSTNQYDAPWLNTSESTKSHCCKCYVFRVSNVCDITWEIIILYFMNYIYQNIRETITGQFPFTRH